MNLKNKTVLIFGDSLSVPEHPNSPGAQLAKLLTSQQGAKGVRFDAHGGRSAHSFFTDPKDGGAAQLAADAATKPDVVIIILGTNDCCLKTIDAREYAAIAAPFQKNGATLIVFGPPWYPDGVTACGKHPKTTKELNASADLVIKMMSSVYGKAFHDSRPLTKAIGIDGRSGVHFTKLGAAVWANNMAKEVAEHKTLQAGGVVLALALLAAAGASGWWLWRKKHQRLGALKALYGR